MARLQSSRLRGDRVPRERTTPTFRDIEDLAFPFMLVFHYFIAICLHRNCCWLLYSHREIEGSSALSLSLGPNSSWMFLNNLIHGGQPYTNPISSILLAKCPSPAFTGTHELALSNSLA
jgi:hypothetical protein